MPERKLKVKSQKSKIRRGFPFLKLSLFLISLGIAWYLATSGYPQQILDRLLPFKLLSAFIAGALYTSYLTTPIAIIAILILSDHMNPFLLALIGGLGGTMTDFLIVKYYRGVYQLFSESSPRHFFRFIEQAFRALHLDLIAVILGALIIASPLPDELGLLLIGASSFSAKKLAVVTYICNSLGILALAYVGKLF